LSDGEAAPTDFDDPNPVTFLSVGGTFRFVVECLDAGAGGRQDELGIRGIRWPPGKVQVRDHYRKRHFKKDDDQKAYEAGYQKGHGN